MINLHSTMCPDPQKEKREDLIEKSGPEKPGKITPAMKQFYEAKGQYPDCIIFFRMGDFYETFCEDAEICARELDITLTSRGRMPDGQDIPLAGVPYHAVEGYLARMISRGYKVAICEQVEDPKKAKGIVKREVIRVVTPGTVIDAALIPSEQARYLMAACPDRKGNSIGLAFLDISTGDFQIVAADSENGFEKVRSAIARFHPAECVVPDTCNEDIVLFLRRSIALVSPERDQIFDEKNARNLLIGQFGPENVDSLGLLSDTVAGAAGAALAYAQKTQFDSLSHISHFSGLNSSDRMILDAVTLRNLEIVQNIRDRSEEGTLVETMDHTSTPMGRRLLRHRITAPLCDPTVIDRRLDAVAFSMDQTSFRQDIRGILHRYPDLERIAGRISYGNASPRDMVTLSNAIEASLGVKRTVDNLEELPDELLSASERISDLTPVSDLIKRAIVDEPPALVRKGGVIRDGYHDELDKLRLISRDGRQWIADLEQKEKEKTGIKSLKIRYNAVFGYYIEVTKTNLGLVPPEYERRQTTANAERFTIPILREMESQIATADERLLTLEEELYTALLQGLKEYISNLQEIASAVGEIDLYAALSEVALKYRYVRPVLVKTPELLIREGRHPVVEASVPGGFVPNDAELSSGKDQIQIITGANMAGKSTYMRSVALITVMAQMGSFVPATYAKIGVVDRIFTRVGAFDDLASGQSTFMVEMLELATILNHVTSQSLVILDEIGRGTSTLDGYCIAKSVLEQLHGKKSQGPRTLFATHFHEIVGIEEELKRVRNCHFAVRESDKDVIFLRRLVPGATDRSYGIHVARLAGVPDQVIIRAEELMKRILSGEETPGGGVKRYTQMILLDTPQSSAPDPLLSEIADIDVDSITPLQALTVLSDLKNRAGSRFNAG